MYFSKDTGRAVASFEDAQSKWEASAKELKRLETRRKKSQNATSTLGKLWAKHVSLPALQDRISSAQKDMERARERMITRAEFALIKMGREVIAGDAELRGRYQELWDDFEQTRFFARLGQQLARTETAVEDALHAMDESDVYLAPGQTPRQILSLAEARDMLYDANEEIFTLQYHLSDRGGQNETVNAQIAEATKLPKIKAALDGLMNADPGASSLSSPEEVTRKAETLREISKQVVRLQGFFDAECATAANEHDAKARNVHKAFLMDEVAKAVATMPEHKDLPQKLAKALGMTPDKPAPKATAKARMPKAATGM